MEYQEVSQAEAKVRVDIKHKLRKAGVLFDNQEPTRSLLWKMEARKTMDRNNEILDEIRKRRYVMRKRVRVISTGNQAPYGIDETIESYANTPAGLRKACKYAASWHDRPLVIDAGGDRIDITTGQKEDY